MKKGFPLLENINNAILKMTESGLLTKWMYESQIDIEKVTLPNNLQSADNSLDVERILSAFVLLAVGLLLSFSVFLIEFVFQSRTLH